MPETYDIPRFWTLKERMELSPDNRERMESAATWCVFYPFDSIEKKAYVNWDHPENKGRDIRDLITDMRGMKAYEGW